MTVEHARTSTHRRRRALAGTGVVLAIIVALVPVLAPGPTAPRTRLALTGFTGPRAAVLAVSGRWSPQRRGRPHHAPAGPISAAENTAIDRTLDRMPYVRIAGAQHREIALTFDDGPGPYTPEVLDVLERMHVPGTFFEVGVEERYFHASTSRIVRDEFPIGDHTENHPPMSELSAANQTYQLLAQTRAIGQYGAPFPRMFRPPYGVWNGTTLALLHRYRMLMILWTVDTEDYRQPGVGAIVGSVLKGARPGAIVLLHDAGGPRAETVAALPEIIRDLRARGYRLVTVPQLLLDNPAPRDQNIAGTTGDWLARRGRTLGRSSA